MSRHPRRYPSTDSTHRDDGTPPSPKFIGDEILSVTSPPSKCGTTSRRRRNTTRRRLVGSRGVESHGSLESTSNLQEVIDQSIQLALEIASLNECPDELGSMASDESQGLKMREAHPRDVLKDDLMLFYRELIKFQTSSSHFKIEDTHKDEGLYHEGL